MRHPEVRRDAIANTAAQSSAGRKRASFHSRRNFDAATRCGGNDCADFATIERDASECNATECNATECGASCSRAARQKNPIRNKLRSRTRTTRQLRRSIPRHSRRKIAPSEKTSAAKIPAEKIVPEKSNSEKLPTATPASEKLEEAPRKPAVAKTPAALTPKAAQVKQKIDDALAERNLTGKASVQGVGNTLMLTGKLRPTQHAALLNLLHDLPAGVKIVDNIGDDSSAPATTSCDCRDYIERHAAQEHRTPRL